MTWIEEILRAFLLTFGVYEVISNSTYLLKVNGLDLARRQHGELPEHLPDYNIKLKVIIMLSFGLILSIVSLSSYFVHSYLKIPTILVLFLFMIYGIIEALYYKYWKTMGFAVVTVIFFLIFLIL